MADQEINDLISKAWDHGTCIAWGDIEDEPGGVTMWDPSKSSPETEPFSVALRHIHQNKINGQYVARNFDIQLKHGGKHGKFWKLETNKCSYTVTYGKLNNDKPVSPKTMTKSFPSAEECYKEAEKKLKEKKKKKYKVDWDRSPQSTNAKYNNQYLDLAIKMDNAAKTYQLKRKQFAQHIEQVMNGVFAATICDTIAAFCNEDRLDHYNCDKVFDDIGIPNSPVARLSEGVENMSDKAPSAFGIHLLQGIYGDGQTFGEDVCYGSIRVFSPKEMKLFATRMIRRLMKVEDENMKQIIFGMEDLCVKNKKRKMGSDEVDDSEPPAKKRKLNDMETECVEAEIVYEDDLIYKVAYALSGSGVFDGKKQAIVWKNIFTLAEEQISNVASTYEGNHSLCALCFGLNAAAMNRGVIAHHW
eukprot:263894_1